MSVQISIEDYKFSDLIDIVDFKQLLESFYKATKIPNTLLDSGNKIISQFGLTKACSQFYKTNFESDLLKEFIDGKKPYSFCKNGLMYYSTPIVVENHHLATLILGEFLDKTPNKIFFTQQAEKFNYDKIKYLEAINSIPIIKKEQIESLMNCIVQMAKMLANNALLKFRETKLEDNLNKSTEEKSELKNILDFSPIGIAWSDEDGNIKYLNHQFIKLFGYTIDDIPNVQVWYEKAYPDIKYKKEVIEPWHKEVVISKQTGILVPDLEVTIRCKDGSERRVFVRVSWIGNKRLVNFNDITQHWKSELRNHIHDSMLEMVAKNTSLSDILNTIVKNMEYEDPGSFCSVLLLDKDEKHLILGAAPNLPDFYNKAVNGVKIAEGVGSCGSAAYLKTRVIADDISTHKYWQPYKSLALRAGLASCWSEPIMSSTGKLLGTFAIYHSKPSIPNSSDMERINFAANLASIAIENRNTRLELEHRAYFDYLTDLPNRRYFIEQAELELSRYHRYGGELSLIMFDIDHFKQINDKYGHSIGDLVLQNLAKISRLILRDVDLIGRIGGEEFAIILPQTNISEALNVAKRLQTAILNEKIIVNEEISFNFTASFGITSACKCTNIDDLLIQVDLALYKAKNSGRNQICISNKND
ncbi:MAG: diguanylate cyclase [Arcobacter sp.]|uniref:diguanylate cyclase n=1 Tax=Arcobacter sp. TaxID=1872629 RepID=UPI002A749D09|nr:diguanylate cyclase [Arcobacter sp.]MDY3199737.1 diguanylate cyclase [Arcobacter sp.]